MQSGNNIAVTKERRRKRVPVPADILKDLNKLVNQYDTNLDFYEATEAAGYKINHGTLKNIRELKYCSPDTLYKVKKLIELLAA